jgi:hypothetical protein
VRREVKGVTGVIEVKNEDRVTGAIMNEEFLA